MRYIIFFTLSFLFIHESYGQKRRVVNQIKEAESKLNYHSGFVLFDPQANKTLIDYQGDRYFTPASNTKIFTLYTSMKILGDSIPGLYTYEKNDSLYLWGTGDPSLLYENVTSSNVVSFLQKQNSNKNLFLSDGHFYDDHFGPGWSWDDYIYAFQVEKAALPVFGNYYRVNKTSGESQLTFSNEYFKSYFWFQDSTDQVRAIKRQYGSNLTEYHQQSVDAEFDHIVPFRYSNRLASELLSDTLSRKVTPIHAVLPKNRNVVYSVRADSLYKVLMQVSDNFIAEQLLLLCSGVLSDSLKAQTAINYAKSNFLNDLPDEPLWVDGSGLSRYNQFTPRSIVKLWEKLYREFGPERLYPILAVGGQSGTIKGWYEHDKPYIYGKTGTLRNHHALSGYLITDKGNTLIFSFMHGHYPGPSSSVKKEMEGILQLIRTKY